MSSDNPELTLFSPAKINLFLAITGIRPDGFHELSSLVAPVQFGDSLSMTLNRNREEPHLICDDKSVPVTADNLIIKAARLFSTKHAFEGNFDFNLKKKIPMGAGLGGGSSNASTALKGMNQLLGSPLTFEELSQLAAQLGSDCPLFLADSPIMMRGRGERLETLPEEVEQFLRGSRIIIFKPSLSISTAWAYGQLKAAQGKYYLSSQVIEAEFEKWCAQPSFENLPLINNMEAVSFKKFLALPVLLEQLRNEFGLKCLMSGSGSACFGILDSRFNLEKMRQTILSAWGEDAFFVETQIL